MPPFISDVEKWEEHTSKIVCFYNRNVLIFIYIPKASRDLVLRVYFCNYLKGTTDFCGLKNLVTEQLSSVLSL